jgi:hypothetical protein
MYRSWPLAALVGIALAALGGCSNGKASLPTDACPDPVRAGRYTMCGKLLSGGSGVAGAQRFHIVGSFQNVPSGVANRYSIHGSSFHGQD